MKTHLLNTFLISILGFLTNGVCVETLIPSDAQVAKEVFQSNVRNFEKIFQYKATGLKNKNQNPDDLEKDSKTPDNINSNISYVRIDTTKKSDQAAQEVCYQKSMDLVSQGTFSLLRSSTKIRGRAIEGDSIYLIADTTFESPENVNTVVTIKGSDFEKFEYAYLEDKSLIRMLDNNGDLFSPLFILQPFLKNKDQIKLTVVTVQDVFGDDGSKLCSVGTVHYFTNYSDKKAAEVAISKEQADKNGKTKKETLPATDATIKELNQKLEKLPEKVKVGCQGDSINFLFLMSMLSILFFTRKKSF